MGVVELDGEGPLPRISSHSKSKSQPRITIEVSKATSVAMIKGVLEHEALRTANQEGKKPLEGGSREVKLGAVVYWNLRLINFSTSYSSTAMA